MAKITLRGNIGNVRTGHQPNGSYISFSVAENHGYRNKQTGDWVDKGTLWHECTYWIYNDPEKFEHLNCLLIKGTPVLVVGRLSINPSEKIDEQTGEVKQYKNQYINVEDIGITLNRIESIHYKPKQDIGGATDPEFQQYVPTQGQPPAEQVQTPPQQPPATPPQRTQTAQAPQQETTPLDDPFPGNEDEDDIAF